MSDHALVYYPRAIQIWKTVGLLSGIDLTDSPTQLFLQSLKLGKDLEAARIQGVWWAYVAYHI